MVFPPVCRVQTTLTKGSTQQTGAVMTQNWTTIPRTACGVLDIMEDCMYLPVWVYDCYVTKATLGRWKSFYDPLSLSIYGSCHLSPKENWKLCAFLPPILFFSFIPESECRTTKLREIQSHGSHLLSLETLKAGFRACTVQFACLRLCVVKRFGSLR